MGARAYGSAQTDSRAGVWGDQAGIRVSSVAFLGIREGSGRVVLGVFSVQSSEALSDVVGGQVAAGIAGRGDGGG